MHKLLKRKLRVRRRMLRGRRQHEPKAKRVRKAKDEKKGSTSNTPKRPLTAFFIFMNDFRKTFKKENPDSKDVKDVAKQGGEKWKSLTKEEKKVYLDKATELKAYNKSLESNDANEEEEAEEEKEAYDAGENEVEDKADDNKEAEGGLFHCFP